MFEADEGSQTQEKTWCETHGDADLRVSLYQLCSSKVGVSTTDVRSSTQPEGSGRRAESTVQGFEGPKRSSVC